MFRHVVKFIFHVYFSQKQTFTLLITLVNVSSSAERSAALRVIESSLTYALGNLTTVIAPTVQIQRYGIAMLVLGYSNNHYHACICNVDGCNPESLNDGTWPETAPGSTASIPCPCTEAEGQLAARVTRQCEGTYNEGARWGSIDDSQCRGRLSGKLCSFFEVRFNIMMFMARIVQKFNIRIATST